MRDPNQSLKYIQHGGVVHRGGTRHSPIGWTLRLFIILAFVGAVIYRFF